MTTRTPTTPSPATDTAAAAPESTWSARPLGGQPQWDPDELGRFVRQARIAVMSYVRADGRPGQAPIWYVERDGVLYANVGTGSPKHRALRRDPRVGITIQDERPPYRAVLFDAVVELADQPARAATDGIERRYFGRIGGAAYRRMVAEEEAANGFTEITMRPTDVRGFDNTVGLHALTVAFLRVRPHLPGLRRVL